MSLLNHIRPKWQNSEADVRAEAVSQLDKGEVELLTAVARQDPDPRVRRIAIKKLEAPRLLLGIAEEDEDPAVREFARERANQILVRIACDERDAQESARALSLLTEPAHIVAVADQARFPDVAEAAFRALPDDDALASLVIRSRRSDQQQRALEKIESPSALKSIVVDDSVGDLALAALGRLSDIPVLESIARQHRVSKAVRRSAHVKLMSLVPAEHPLKVEAREKRFAELCCDAESLANERPTRPAEVVARLQTAWLEVAGEAPASSSLTERFQTAITALSELERKRLTRLESEPGEPPAAREQVSTSAVEGAAEGAADAAPGNETAAATGAGTDTNELSGLRERLAGPADESLADVIAEARSAYGEPLSSAIAEAEARLARWKRADELAEHAQTAAELEDVAEATRAFRAVTEGWRDVSESASESQAARFRSARDTLTERKAKARHAHEAERQAATLAEVEAGIARLTALASQDEVLIRDAEKEMREALDFLKSMGPLPPSANRKKLRRQLADAREALFKKTQETRDNESWKRWANSDIQEGLIARVEALRTSKDIPKVAKELRLIHEEWKRSGATVPEKAEKLWQRYKSLRDELKVRCDAFFETQNQERGQNLEKKQALCERVEAIKDSDAWRETADAIKAIQAEWKSIGPVPTEASEALWKRFRSACDHFFSRRNEDLDRLKGERTANLRKKQALCDRAEALQNSLDWNATANELKSLQVEWKAIGPIPRNKSEALWARFRAACDHFFDRNKRRDEVEDEERVKSRVALVDQIEALDASNSEAADKARDVWLQWKKLDTAATAPAPPLTDRMSIGLSAIVSGAPDAFRGSELDPQVSESKRRKIVEELERVVEKLDAPAAGGEALEDLAARLKDALASNTMTGGKGRDERAERRARGNEVTRLRSSWLRAAPLGGEAGALLQKRFDTAYQRYVDLERDPETRQDQSA